MKGRGGRTSSPERLLKRLNIPYSPFFLFLITGKENLKNSQCFRFTTLIRDRGEKINSLMSGSHLSDNNPARRDDGMGDRLRKEERETNPRDNIFTCMEDI